MITIPILAMVIIGKDNNALKNCGPSTHTNEVSKSIGVRYVKRIKVLVSIGLNTINLSR